MKWFLWLMTALLSFQGYSQEVKVYETIFLNEAPRIDGDPSENTWQQLTIAEGFRQYQTRPGEPVTKRTEIRMGYDHSAIYVAAWLFDNAPDSILHEIGLRDQENTNADEFSVILDTYHDKINGYEFRVTAAGVQSDIRYSSNDPDPTWNAVWYSKVAIHEEGWYVEMKIPFSAIRFQGGDALTWGLNFSRGIRRYREISYWNPVNPQIDGFINQSGVLRGLKEIEPPLRLSVTPYVASYVYQSNDPTNPDLSMSASAGMDLKYGISESFTLDLTLIPDFGQVQSDNLVLNLSPYEVRFNEFRPFFTEGTELFNKGGFFYSRRVGGEPMLYSSVRSQLYNDEVLIENPSTTQLLNAFKFSGRTSGGLGIGVFNAITASEHAEAQRVDGTENRSLQTNPLTNYSVIVADQSLKNNSYISFVNTNVLRSGHYRDAQVSGGLFRLVNKSNTLAASGKAAVAVLTEGDQETTTGHEAAISLSKISGRFNASIEYSERSDDYDINDLGYLAFNNTRDLVFGTSYNIYKPFWKVNNLFNSFYVGYSRLYNPDAFWNFFLEAESMTTLTKSFFTMGLNAVAEPITTYDYFEPRTPGYFYTFPVNYRISGWISSDYRKTLAIDSRLGWRWFDDEGRESFNFSLSPRWRISNRVLLVFSSAVDRFSNDVGFASRVDDNPLMGRRDVNTYTQTINGRFAFSALMNVTLRLRHYWSQAVYSQYHYLSADGYLIPADYSGSHDVNFNAVNLDIIYTWNFAPGSELNLTMKAYQLEQGPDLYSDYLKNLSYLESRPLYNTISLKVLYYIDYLSLMRRDAGKNKMD